MDRARNYVSAIAVSVMVVALCGQPASGAASFGKTFDNVVGGPPGGTAKWHKVFEDNFDGTTLDHTKWHHSWRDPSGPGLSDSGTYNWGPSEYAPDCIRVKDGNMELITRKKAGGGYETGVVQTLGLFEYTFGYAEARIHIPQGRGLWAAFWMISTELYDWPPEIDVFETPDMDGGNTNIYQTWHGTVGDQVQEMINPNQDPWNVLGSEWMQPPGPGFCGDYHIYAANWTPDSVCFYIDGVMTLATTFGVSEVRDRKYYMIIDEMLHGGWGEAVDEATVLPATMKTDWVRVWQKGATGTVNRPAERSIRASSSPALAVVRPGMNSGAGVRYGLTGRKLIGRASSTELAVIVPSGSGKLGRLHMGR